MNYLAHGWRFTDEPYCLAGTAAPDWLSVIDRKIRLRSRTAAEFVSDADPILAAVARGVVQHHADDAWFHALPAFNELSLAFPIEIRDAPPRSDGLRPGFLASSLVGLRRASALAEEEPGRPRSYSGALAALDPPAVGRAISGLAARAADRIATLIPRFATERFLY